jgi:uncharacterized protein YjbI with pentapeptide repeats
MTEEKARTLQRLTSLSPEMWNRWVAARRVSEDGAFYSWRDLGHLELVGRDFSGRNLCGASFVGSHIRNCSFKGCALRGVDLSLAYIERCDFSETLLYGVKMRNATIRYADFTRSRRFYCVVEKCGLASRVHWWLGVHFGQMFSLVCRGHEG